MDTYAGLTESEFSQAVFRDARESMRHSQKGTLVPEDAEVDEYQFYLQGVGFHLAHALTMIRQLESAVEFLTNKNGVRVPFKNGVRVPFASERHRQAKRGQSTFLWFPVDATLTLLRPVIFGTKWKEASWTGRFPVM